jgi:hypothetical protein
MSQEAFSALRDIMQPGAARTVNPVRAASAPAVPRARNRNADSALLGNVG